MAINREAYKKLIAEFDGKVKLIAVSKTKSVEEIRELYDLGQRDFGENYVSELVQKKNILPADIKWHFIGHLQTNKVKLIVPFVELVHGVDSKKLLIELNRSAEKNNCVINCLLQVHIAEEETKFGFNEHELNELLLDTALLDQLKNIKISGLMRMASFTTHENKIRSEFKRLRNLFDKYAQRSHKAIQFSTLSMGMSADYCIAIEEGSNLVRIGSLLFGER